MRIVQVVHSFPPYNMTGSEVYTYNLSQELVRRHKVFIFHRINDIQMKDYELRQSNFDNLDIFTINNTFRNYDSFEMTYRNDVIARRFSWVLDQIKPDIVHIQHLLYLSAKIIEETEKRQIPIVFTLHDFWLLCPQGQLLKNNIDVCNKESNMECTECVLYQLSIKKGTFNSYYFLNKFIPDNLFQILKNTYLTYCKLSLTKNRLISLIESRLAYMKNVCSKVAVFIAPSNFLKNKFVEFGIPEHKITVLRYGFNLDKFKNCKKTFSEKIRFGFIGNLLPAKGVHILISAFNRIKNPSTELKIYGQENSYKGMLGNYVNRIKKLAKNRNIKFMGGFDNKEVAGIFAEVDILVVPSIWYENSPLVIQEAFASNTPVVASRIGGIPELISDGINGLLFRPNDIFDLYEKINLTIENPSLVEKIKQNIKLPKTIEEDAKELENIYERLLSQCSSTLALS